MARSVAGYFESIGIVPDKTSTEHPQLSEKNIMFGLGTENLYITAMHSLMNKDDVALVVSPSFGIFTYAPEDAGGKTEAVPTREENNYRLTAEDLEARIVELNKQVKLEFWARKEKRASMGLPVKESEDEEVPCVKVFIFTNPDNPTGNVYTKEEVESFAEVLKRHDVKVIDDQVYRGTELDRTAVPYPFAAVEGMFANTITITGLSKSYCMPALRSAVMCGPDDLVKGIKKTFKENVGTLAPLPSVVATAATFNTDPETVTARETYLAKNAEEYTFRRDLLAALANGIDTIPKEKRQRIRECVASYADNADELLEGCPYMKTLGLAESGFFQLLDASEAEGLFAGVTRIDSAKDLIMYLSKEAKVYLLPSDAFIWPDEKMTLRTSYSLPREDIIEGAIRTRAAMLRLSKAPQIEGWHDNLVEVCKERIERNISNINAIRVHAQSLPELTREEMENEHFHGGAAFTELYAAAIALAEEKSEQALQWNKVMGESQYGVEKAKRELWEQEIYGDDQHVSITDTGEIHSMAADIAESDVELQKEAVKVGMALAIEVATETTMNPETAAQLVIEIQPKMTEIAREYLSMAKALDIAFEGAAQLGDLIKGEIHVPDEEQASAVERVRRSRAGNPGQTTSTSHHYR